MPASTRARPRPASAARRGHGWRSRARRRRSGRAGRPGSTPPTTARRGRRRRRRRRSRRSWSRCRGCVAGHGSGSFHGGGGDARPRPPAASEPASMAARRSGVVARGDVVGPQHERVLDRLGVVALAHPGRHEAEPPVEGEGGLVGGPHLEGHGAGAELTGPADQHQQQPRGHRAALVIGVDGDGGDVGLAGDQERTGEPDDTAGLAGHEVDALGRPGRARRRRARATTASWTSGPRCAARRAGDVGAWARR